MRIKHQPLQPLPFSTGSLNKTIAAADGEYVAETASIQDSEYLTHAANAYPKLVEALRRKIAEREALNASLYKTIKDASDAELDADKALLRELGEA